MGASAVAERRPMARKSSRNDVQVKLDAEVVRAARIVSAYRDVTMAEYLSGLLKPLVMRDLATEQAKGVGGEKKKAPKAGTD
jgi:hypothetical protein